MPWVLAVDGREGLRKVEVEEAVGWECPGFVVGAVDEEGDNKD